MTDRFTDFLKSLEADTYPEPPSQIHEEITARVLPEVVGRIDGARVGSGNAEPLRVLDVGCGQGVALKRFKELGCDAVGITTNRTDFAACRENGLTCDTMDMHDVARSIETAHAIDRAIPVEFYDLIWARHVLEHSPAPLFALREFWRVLKPGGWLYIEVPMPGTACRHETNQNHYSVLTCGMWQALIDKVGFQLIEGQVIPLNTQAGPDEYRSYLCRK